MTDWFWTSFGPFEYELNGKKVKRLGPKNDTTALEIWKFLFYSEDSPYGKKTIIPISKTERKVVYTMSIRDLLKMASDKEKKGDLYGVSTLQIYERLYRLSQGKIDGNIALIRFDMKYTPPSRPYRGQIQSPH